MSYVLRLGSSEKRILFDLIKFRLFHIDKLLLTSSNYSSHRLLYEKERLNHILESNRFDSLIKDVSFASVKKIKANRPHSNDR